MSDTRDSPNEKGGSARPHTASQLRSPSISRARTAVQGAPLSSPPPRRRPADCVRRQPSRCGDQLLQRHSHTLAHRKIKSPGEILVDALVPVVRDASPAIEEEPRERRGRLRRGATARLSAGGPAEPARIAAWASCRRRRRVALRDDQVKVMREADRMPANFGAATAHQPRPTGTGSAGPERGACHRGLPRLAAHLRQLARPTPVAAAAVGAPVAGDDCQRGSPAFRDRDCRVSPEDGGRRGPEASSQPWYRYGVMSTQERAALPRSQREKDLDRMLADWGDHLHFSNHVETDGFVARGNELLFAVFGRADVYLVGI
jgi:hypothetical protein